MDDFLLRTRTQGHLQRDVVAKFLFLPHDVVANILCRLSLKSLHRLKTVCKQWSATISDPTLMQTHLQQSKTSFRSFIHPSTHELKRYALENNEELRELSPLQYPRYGANPYGESSRLWCYCDGLFLVSFSDNRACYHVWNPSRGTYKELFYPYPVDSDLYPRIGIYFNPLVNDYKVVIVEAKHYAVFSCNNNSWSEMRSNEISFSKSERSYLYSRRVGVPYNESIYWIWPHSQIVCFDGKDEKLKIFCKLDWASRDELLTSRDGLYVMSFENIRETEMVIRKILPVWMEHKVQLPAPHMSPLGFTHQNKLIFMQVIHERLCQLYDCGGRCFDETITPSFSFSCSRLFPYLENLL